MAVQVKCDELNGCKTYFEWLMDFVRKVHDSETGTKLIINKNGSSTGATIPSVEVCRVMFETDFRWNDSIKEDEIRATDAMELRRRYADEVGENAGKSEREIDRIWKSVLGKCSVFEIILNLCVRLDEMVNEEEEGSMIGLFFRILCGNLKLNAVDFGDLEWFRTTVKVKISIFLDRSYDADGHNGGLFPLENNGGKDQTKVPIWYQMNAWLAEHLDEDEHFKTEQFLGVSHG